MHMLVNMPRTHFDAWMTPRDDSFLVLTVRSFVCTVIVNILMLYFSRLQCLSRKTLGQLLLDVIDSSFGEGKSFLDFQTK